MIALVTKIICGQMIEHRECLDIQVYGEIFQVIKHNVGARTGLCDQSTCLAIGCSGMSGLCYGSEAEHCLVDR